MAAERITNTPLLTLLRADELVDKPVGGMTCLRGCMGCRGIVQRRCGGGELIGAAEQRAGLAYQRHGDFGRIRSRTVNHRHGRSLRHATARTFMGVVAMRRQ